MIIRAIIFFLVLCAAVIRCAWADILTLESGRTVEGSIVERTDEFIRMTVDGKERLFLAHEITTLNGHPYSSPVLSNYKELAGSITDSSLDAEGVRGSVSVVGPPPTETGHSAFRAELQGAVEEFAATLPAAVVPVQTVTASPRKTARISDARQLEDLKKFWPLIVPLVLFALGLGYAYPSFCLMRIAQKASVESSWMAWVPVANAFLMCKIAGMSYLWLLGFLAAPIPLIGPFVVVGIMVYIWYNISLARNKPGWLGFITILPLGYWIVLSILAFADGEGSKSALPPGQEVKVDRPGSIELQSQGVFSWPVWEKEVSRFEWHYDKTEQCYLLEGEVVLEYGQDKKVLFGKGDFIIFPKGLSCVWDIKKAVKKHYRFV